MNVARHPGSPEAAVREGRCPFCDGTDFERFTASAYDVPGQRIELTICRHCEVAWQGAPRAHDSAALMQHCHEGSAGFWSPEQITSRTRLQAAFVTELAQPGRLLDVGGADGAFAGDAAKLGWDCTIVDPAFPSQRMSDRVNVINGFVSDLPATPTYDLATMWAMIEHVPDYVALLRDAFIRLKPGGKLVIEALNYQCLDRMRAKGEWWGFQADHQWYLSPAVYGRNLIEIGFKSWEMARTVLRENWSGEPPEPRCISAVKQIVKRPAHAGSILQAFRAERDAMQRWPDWYGYPLTLLIATK